MNKKKVDIKILKRRRYFLKFLALCTYRDCQKLAQSMCEHLSDVEKHKLMRGTSYYDRNRWK